MERLSANGDVARVGNTSFRTPGIRGSVRRVNLTPAGTRAVAEQVPNLIDAFDEAEARLRASDAPGLARVRTSDMYALTIDGIDERRTRKVRSARLTNGIEMDAPRPGSQLRQVVLAINEDGVATWNFPEPDESAAATVRGGKKQKFVIRAPLPLERPAGDDGKRGVLTGAVKIALKVLVFPVVEKVVGAFAETEIHKWEMKHRSYLVRAFEPGSYGQGGAAALADADWRRLAAGRALLFLHGTFSRSDRGFGSFAEADFRALHDAYGGRLLAFDHPTMSETPIANADAFLKALPPDVKLELDVLCHSRGGLVARAIAGAERPNLDIRNVVFTATPNDGTILVHTDHMGSYIERYTNMLSLLPDNGLTFALEMLVLTAQHIASGVVDHLAGLQAMLPDGPFLKESRLSRALGPDTAYYALASNFEPRNAGWKALVRDTATDLVFGKAGNDLVVPTDGVHSGSLAPGFPILEPQLFGVGDGIAHSGYFKHGPAVTRIHEWLDGGRATAPVT